MRSRGRRRPGPSSRTTSRAPPSSPMGLTWRIAQAADPAALEAAIDHAAGELQQRFLTPEQAAASRAIMGLDRQVVVDGTSFVVEAEGRIAGCGGWSRRATLYGGGHTSGRDPELLDPAKDAARVRAMYTHPAFARRG